MNESIGISMQMKESSIASHENNYQISYSHLNDNLEKLGNIIRKFTGTSLREIFLEENEQRDLFMKNKSNSDVSECKRMTRIKETTIAYAKLFQDDSQLSSMNIHT